MVWTSPRTWQPEDLVTADDFNEQLRDNLIDIDATLATLGTPPVANNLAVVNYAGAANVPRPTDATVVIWQGFPTEPTNMTDADLWLSTSTDAIFRSGTAAPTSGVGNDGDVYLQTGSSPILYGPKAAGAWPAGVSLVGPAGAGSAITVQDEGTALATAATTLNFVGSTVTASGTGATKTITVTGGSTATAPVDYTVPSPGKRATFDRTIATVASTTYTPGTLYLTGVVLYAGDIVTNIRLKTGAEGFAGVTNSWAGIYDLSRTLLAVSADDPTSLASSIIKTWPLSSAYTVPTSGLYYIGVMVAGTAVAVWAATGLNSNVAGITPQMCGRSNTGLTTPQAVGTVATTLSTAPATPMYAWTS